LGTKIEQRSAHAAHSAHAAQALRPFRAAGRTLFSFGLVKGTEGNLSAWNGTTFVITRTGAALDALSGDDLIAGSLEGDRTKELAEASTDVEVHRRLYRSRGSGAVVHAHPAGTVPEGETRPGTHGIYVFGPSPEAAVEEAVRQARSRRSGRSKSAVKVKAVGRAIEWRAVEWRERSLRILDQRRLPAAEEYIEVSEPAEVAEAIRSMAVRGAPLLGIVVGYGMALAALRSPSPGTRGLIRDLERAARKLRDSRPTAANIAWAVDRVLRSAQESAGRGEPAEAVRLAVLEEASVIAAEDEASCRAIGRLGAALVPERASILTHCNTGALATGGYGTAQGVILEAHLAGKQVHVWVDETRPLLQGARLTSWELQRLGIPMTLVADDAAGSLMARGLVDLVVVGADRIAANGDVANKVGTYQLAVLAKRHRIPFYVAAPLSTVDPSTRRGGDVVIEERDPREVTEPLGIPFAPRGTPAANPAFDMTPAGLITAIVTDRGVARGPFGPALKRLGRAAAPGQADPEPFTEVLE
jgi:methylthioribose-1-phosphate isomerase